MGCIRLDILEKSTVPLKVVYRKSDVGKKGEQSFMSVDPLADMFPGFTPYHYIHNNPLRFIDPTGMEADDIIIRTQAEDGSYEQLIRIETDKFDVTFDIDPAIICDYDLSIDPVCLNQAEFESIGIENPQAMSFIGVNYDIVSKLIDDFECEEVG